MKKGYLDKYCPTCLLEIKLSSNKNIRLLTFLEVAKQKQTTCNKSQPILLEVSAKRPKFVNFRSFEFLQFEIPKGQ